MPVTTPVESASLAVERIRAAVAAHDWSERLGPGQQVTVSDEVAQHVLGLARQIITPEARGGGSFADPIEAGPDAGLLDRLIAFTGRTNTQ